MKQRHGGRRSSLYLRLGKLCIQLLQFSRPWVRWLYTVHPVTRNLFREAQIVEIVKESAAGGLDVADTASYVT